MKATTSPVSRDRANDLLRNHVRLVSFSDKGENVGVLLRTAEALRVQHVAFAESPATRYKSAMGADKWQPWSAGDPLLAVEIAKDLKYHIVGVELTEDSRPIWEADLRGPVCFILGNERVGIPDDVAVEVDEWVEIPMSGFTRCLNVAVAGSIALYEWVRQNEGGTNGGE